jgi:hypothetical protein
MTTKYFEESLKEFSCHDCLLTCADCVAHYSESRIRQSWESQTLFLSLSSATVARKLAEGFIPWFSCHWDDGQCAVSLPCCSTTV